MSLTAQPRFTNDVDAVIWADRSQWESLVRARAAHGFHRASLTPSSLPSMKAVADRQQDALDIERIVSVTPNLDVRRIRRWVKDFADVLEAPELLADLNRMLGEK